MQNGKTRCMGHYLSCPDTKVTSLLEQGQRRQIWHLQNLMLDPDNAKSRRDRCMCNKLDKEKGR